MFNSREKVILVQDYTDEFGNRYKKGQTGIIGKSTRKGDKHAIFVADGYEEARTQVKKVRERKREREIPNVVSYIAEVPINILKKAIKHFKKQ